MESQVVFFYGDIISLKVRSDIYRTLDIQLSRAKWMDQQFSACSLVRGWELRFSEPTQIWGRQGV